MVKINSTATLNPVLSTNFALIPFPASYIFYSSVRNKSVIGAFLKKMDHHCYNSAQRIKRINSDWNCDWFRFSFNSDKHFPLNKLIFSLPLFLIFKFFQWDFHDMMNSWDNGKRENVKNSKFNLMKWIIKYENSKCKFYF